MKLRTNGPLDQKHISVKKSPFVFLKLLVIIEFFFALLPFGLAVLLRAENSYNSSGLAQAVPYSLLVTIAMTTLQVLIIAIAFAAWYFPTYHIDSAQIIYQRGNLFEDRPLVDTQSITEIDHKQGRLARRFDYGSLVIESTGLEELAIIRDIPNPRRYGQIILQMVESAAQPLLPPETAPLEELINNGESQRVEFKASLMWDYRRQAVNKELYVPVMKNVVAFMNTTGGTLLIGVSDDGELLGLEPDFKSIKKQDSDGFENVFNMAFNRMIGPEYRQFADITFPEIDGKIISVVAVRPSAEPAYLIHKGTEKFYIRTGNSTQPLSVSKATKYIQSHFED